ncbi:MAG: ribonuclease HII [Candidatus Xenobiia bacterium LiM19]
MNKRRFLSTYANFLMSEHDYSGASSMEDAIALASPELNGKKAESIRTFLAGERERLHHMMSIERSVSDDTGSMVAGADEAGRGPMAGPLVAAAVVFRKIPFIPCVNDSKLLQREDREVLSVLIKRTASSYAVAVVTPEEIDEMNIHRASLEAMSRALRKLTLPPCHVLVDGAFTLPGIEIPQRAVKKGDRRCFTVACASILAKTTRDAIMDGYDSEYQHYGFGNHKGYCTKEHMEAIKNHGILPIHRRTYGPVKECLCRSVEAPTGRQ